MQKTISVIINNTIFYVEEEGYKILKDYLDSIHNYFSSYEDSKEVIADIESRIAEIFQVHLQKTKKQSITIEQVNALIASMGNVEDFVDAEEKSQAKFQNKEEEEEESDSDSRTKKLQRDTKRKVVGGVCSGLAHHFEIDPIWPRVLFILLVIGYGVGILLYLILWIAIPGSNQMKEVPAQKLYRNPKGKILGGVSGGLSSYLKIDVALIRIIFIVSIFFGGVGLLFYLILWILLPKANTLTEKMEMEGERVTLSSIDSTMRKKKKDKSGSYKDELDPPEESNFIKVILFPFRLLGQILNGLGVALRPLLNSIGHIIRVLIGLGFISVGLAIIIGALAIGMVALGFHYNIFWFDFLSYEASIGFPFEAFRLTFSIWIFVFLFLVLFIPGLFSILIGLSIITRQFINAFLGWTLFILFLISLVGMALTIPHYVYLFKKSGHYQVENVYTFDDRMPAFKIQPGTPYNSSLIHASIYGHDGEEIRIVKKFEAHGSTRRRAMDHAKTISYEITQQDSMLLFDAGVRFSENVPFYAQQLSLYIYVPYNTPFAMDYDVQQMIDSPSFFDNQYDDDKDTTHIYTIQDNRITCLSCSLLSTQEQKNQESIVFKDFSKIDIKGNFNVLVKQDTNFSFRGPRSEEHDSYETHIRGESLIIRPTHRYNPMYNLLSKKEKTNIYITLPSLESVKAKGTGKIKMKGFNELDMNIKIMGAIQAECDCEINELNTNITGASSLTLTGKGDELRAHIKGASTLHGFDYLVENANIDLTGASSAQVSVDNTLYIDKGVACSIAYKNQPQTIYED